VGVLGGRFEDGHAVDRRVHQSSYLSGGDARLPGCAVADSGDSSLLVGTEMPIATHSQTNLSTSSNTMGIMRAMKEDSGEKINPSERTEPSAKKWIRCDTSHCGNAAVGLLALRFYCVGHFISHCYEYLERCNCNPLRDADVVTSFSVDRFLQQCVAQTGELVRPIRGFDNLDRARLFDIFLWASDLIAKRNVFKEESASSAGARSYSAELSKKMGAD
jgi:hypothetical protein